jgi:hypothetical protein
MMQLTLSEVQQAVALAVLVLAIPTVLCGFLLGFIFHDSISYWSEVFFRWLRRRQFRNKVRAYRGN